MPDNPYVFIQPAGPIDFSGFANLGQQKKKPPEQQLGPDGLPVLPNNGQYDPNWSNTTVQQAPQDKAALLMQLGKLFGFGG